MESETTAPSNEAKAVQSAFMLPAGMRRLLYVRLCVDVFARLLASCAVTVYATYLAYMAAFGSDHLLEEGDDGALVLPVTLVIFVALLLPSPFSSGSVRIKEARVKIKKRLAGNDRDDSDE